MFNCSIDYLLRDAIEDPSPIAVPAEKPKKKRRIIAATIATVLVVALLAAAFIPRRGLVTIDCEEGFRATYKETGTVAYLTRTQQGVLHIKGAWQDVPNEQLSDLDIEFTVVDYKNIPQDCVGNTIMTNITFNALYLKDDSGKFIVFEMIDYEDYPDEQETA